MRHILVLLCFCLFTIYCNGQSSIVISGRVVDKQSKEALSFSTIVYEDKSIGTISDVDGYFTLSLNEVKSTEKMVISYLGYKSIALTIDECQKSQSYQLEPISHDLVEVVVAAEKFKLKSFIKEVVADYNKSRRSKPHIAIAHYREKAKKAGEYIMFMESIGYSVYAGNLPNAAPLSNYKFFCENTRCYVDNPEWIKFKENRGGSPIENVAPSGSSNLNVFRTIEHYGFLSNKWVSKYTFKMDSSYFIGSNPVYCINFKGNNAKGSIHVYSDTKQILKIDYLGNAYWSEAFGIRLKARVDIRFNYFDNSPFISSINANYTRNGLQYSNNLNVLVQKFDQFELSDEEYWSLNSYAINPYIEYQPEIWKVSNIDEEQDYVEIESGLKSQNINLEDKFIDYSGRWFFSEKERNEVARRKVNELKSNF